VPTNPREKARQFALLKAELLAVAIAAVDKLTDDQCEAIYFKIEERLAAATNAAGTTTASTPEPMIETPTAEPTIETPTDVPIEVAKRRAAEDIERDHLTRIMEQSNGTISDAARIAGVDRTNFRRRLQRAGLREPGNKRPAQKHTDRILKLLDADRTGLRASEIAKRIRLALPNVWSLLKYLERKKRIQRHGAHHNTTWALPGVDVAARVDSIPAMIVDVLSNESLPLGQRFIARQVESRLHRKGRKLNEATLRHDLLRLLEKGVIAFHGANEHGALYALTVPVSEEGSDLN
jgi:DNA-binding Lrp family transcriptional regulator